MASPYKVKYKAAKRSSEMSKISLLLIIFSLVLGGFIYAVLNNGSNNPPENEDRSIYPKIQVKDLGKTVSHLKEKYPDLLLSRNRDGLIVAKHKLKDAHHTIWFVAENKDFIAFRIKASRTYDQLEEKELLKHFGKMFGRSFDNYCKGRSIYVVESCHYKWWAREAVSLDVYTRTNIKQMVVLDAITTDTYLSTKHHKIIRTILPIQ